MTTSTDSTMVTDTRQRAQFMSDFDMPLPGCGASLIPGALGCDRPIYHEGPHHAIYQHIGEQLWMDQAELRRQYEAGR